MSYIEVGIDLSTAKNGNFMDLQPMTLHITNDALPAAPLSPFEDRVIQNRTPEPSGHLHASGFITNLRARRGLYFRHGNGLQW